MITLRRALENSQEPRDRATCSTAASTSRPAMSLDRVCALAQEAQSTRNACATIRSCSARSRCGRSISPRSMRRSPTKACGRRRTRSRRSSRTASVVYRAHRPRSVADRLGRPASRSTSSRRCCRASSQRGTARRHRATMRAVRGRQDRHHRQRERRLVRRLHQRRDGGGLGRLRQRRRQAPHARRRRDRRQRRGPDLRADHAGGLDAPCAEGGARAAVAGGGAQALVALPDRPARPARTTPSTRRRRPRSLVEYFRRDRNGAARRHPVPAGVARRGQRLCAVAIPSVRRRALGAAGRNRQRLRRAARLPRPWRGFAALATAAPQPQPPPQQPLRRSRATPSRVAEHRITLRQRTESD